MKGCKKVACSRICVGVTCAEVARVDASCKEVACEDVPRMSVISEGEVGVGVVFAGNCEGTACADVPEEDAVDDAFMRVNEVIWTGLLEGVAVSVLFALAPVRVSVWVSMWVSVGVSWVAEGSLCASLASLESFGLSMVCL